MEGRSHGYVTKRSGLALGPELTQFHKRPGRPKRAHIVAQEDAHVAGHNALVGAVPAAGVAAAAGGVAAATGGVAVASGAALATGVDAAGAAVASGAVAVAVAAAAALAVGAAIGNAEQEPDPILNAPMHGDLDGQRYTKTLHRAHLPVRRRWYFEGMGNADAIPNDSLLPQLRRLLHRGPALQGGVAGAGEVHVEPGVVITKWGKGPTGFRRRHGDVAEENTMQVSKLYDLSKSVQDNTRGILAMLQRLLKGSGTYLPPNHAAPAGDWWAFQHPLQCTTELHGPSSVFGMGSSHLIPRNMCMVISPAKVAETQWVYITKEGYVRLLLGERGFGRTERVMMWECAHRIVLWAFEGPPTMQQYTWAGEQGIKGNGLVVCHTCNNKLCLNPHHLVYGTEWENNGKTTSIASGEHFRRALLKAEMEAATEVAAQSAIGAPGVHMVAQAAGCAGAGPSGLHAHGVVPGSNGHARGTNARQAEAPAGEEGISSDAEDMNNDFT